jgi:hypothetical protein
MLLVAAVVFHLVAFHFAHPLPGHPGSPFSHQFHASTMGLPNQEMHGAALSGQHDAERCSIPDLRSEPGTPPASAMVPGQSIRCPDYHVRIPTTAVSLPARTGPDRQALLQRFTL